MRATEYFLVALTALNFAASPAAVAQDKAASAPAAVASAPVAAASAAAPAGKPETSASLASSVLLVDELLRADNQAAREALHKNSLLPPVAGGPGGSGPVAPPVKVVPPPVQVRVVALFGLNDDSHATVLVDGMTLTASPGTVLGGACRVEVIRDRCVVLTPVKAARKGDPVRCLPKSCWVGDNAASFAGGGSGMGEMPPAAPGQGWAPGQALPRPSPLPAN